MTEDIGHDSMLDIFVFEIMELISQAEGAVLNSENENAIEDEIDEIFRIVHTIKGNASMMDFESIATVAHSLEDVLSHIRENHPKDMDYSTLADIILKSMDYIKNEVTAIQAGESENQAWPEVLQEINQFLFSIKGDRERILETASFFGEDENGCESTGETGKTKYKALIYFEDDCKMENLRAFNVVNELENVADIINYIPRDIIENDESAEIIRKNGFEICFASDLSFENVSMLISDTILLKDFKLEILETMGKDSKVSEKSHKIGKNSSHFQGKQSMISVSISKLDKLMNLVGELVISQSMVIQNPDLEGLASNSFIKASRQLQKVTNEVQDAVMSIRMVSLSVTFQKMHRVVRDMSKKLGKNIKLEIIGEGTEVDKSIIEHLSDPIMHMIRNAVDHGIEYAEEREEKGKPAAGRITLEARNEGGAVWIIVKDDGRGLDKESILRKAKAQGLLDKADDELTDREIYSCIFMPGFSTNDEITEYSGRGVGMDVVDKNIKDVGGAVIVDSIPGKGTTISIKIPLTLAIIDGMKLKVGKSTYIIPITSIKESLRVQDSMVIKDEANNSEMLMIRGDCYSLLRLHELFKVKSDASDLSEGIIVMIEHERKMICLFADELLGTQQVVVKALPQYLKTVKGISGCTVMGNGNVGLILDVSWLVNSAFL